MNKQDWIKKIYSGYEDGTGEGLSDVLSKHPVEDLELIEESYDEICSYIGFCMHISVRYWCEEENKYIPNYFKENEVDLSKWEISYIDGTKYYPDTELENTFILPLMRMFKDEKRIRSKNDLNHEEKTRIDKYGHGYGYLFAQLLDGYTYK